MRRTSNFPPQYWVSERKRSILKKGLEHQVLYTYLCSAPHSHMYGIFYLPPFEIVEHLSEQFSGKDVERVLADLEKANVILRDSKTHVIWVIGMAGDNFRSEWTANQTQLKGAEKHLESLPQSRVCEAFAQHYGVPYRYPRDTLTDTLLPSPVRPCPVPMGGGMPRLDVPEGEPRPQPLIAEGGAK